MSDKKKKSMATDEPIIVAKIEIMLFNNGHITLTGPIKNSVLTLRMFGKGMEALADFVAKGSTSESRLVAPQGPKIVTLN